ncbi:probable nuclear transport factor 2 [Venturia canescens]|uniref:probable nuclear transport factor 2 n=1 Tax=Venturia canescens TaxID=32260 RepID=UPI001C9C2640|nr:probable nuclear transport factor 2 [Venturia canescens]
MALNPMYREIGEGFVKQYYQLFDDPVQRPSLINMYNEQTSFMSFEGLQLQGAAKIMDKLNSLPFQNITRVITTIDCQPMFDGGVLIKVLGRLKADDDPPHPFSQIFVLSPLANSYFCQHDIFRLGIHNSE